MAALEKNHIRTPPFEVPLVISRRPGHGLVQLVMDASPGGAAIAVRIYVEKYVKDCTEGYWESSKMPSLTPPPCRM